MFNKRLSLVTVLIASTALTGCANPSPIPHEKVGDLSSHRASHGTTYALEQWHRAGADSTQPAVTNGPSSSTYFWMEMQRVRVNRLERVGFRRDGNKLVAFGGTRTIELPEGIYQWRDTDSVREDAHIREATTNTVIVVGCIALVILGIVGFLVLNSDSGSH